MASTSFFDLNFEQRASLLEEENLKLFEALEAVALMAESSSEDSQQVVEGIKAVAEMALDEQRC
jgi:hypothetical protein